MTNGIDTTGFNETKAGDTNNLDLNPTGQGLFIPFTPCHKLLF